MLRSVLLLVLAGLLLSGCSARPDPAVLIPHPEVAGAADPDRVIRVYAASNRAAVNGYENLPAFATTYRYYDIAVPDEVPGAQIAYPEGDRPDPTRSYVVLDSGVLTRPAFLAATRGAGTGPDSEAGLYIHGYNTRFQEALFRLAQIAVEADAGVAPVLFSWPSTSRPLEHEADRQAALFSRQELADLITDLTAGNRRLMVFGHSMGAFLTMESLRTLKLTSQEDVLARLDVVLAAPDIDVFTFIRLMQEVGPLSAPMVILSSPTTGPWPCLRAWRGPPAPRRPARQLAAGGRGRTARQYPDHRHIGAGSGPHAPPALHPHGRALHPPVGGPAGVAPARRLHLRCAVALSGGALSAAR